MRTSRRSVVAGLEAAIELPQALLQVIVGPRQVGKTTAAREPGFVVNVVARSPQVDVRQGAASVDDRSVAVATLPGRSRRSDAAGRELRRSQQMFTTNPG